MVLLMTVIIPGHCHSNIHYWFVSKQMWLMFKLVTVLLPPFCPAPPSLLVTLSHWMTSMAFAAEATGDVKLLSILHFILLQKKILFVDCILLCEQRVRVRVGNGERRVTTFRGMIEIEWLCLHQASRAYCWHACTCVQLLFCFLAISCFLPVVMLKHTYVDEPG